MIRRRARAVSAALSAVLLATGITAAGCKRPKLNLISKSEEVSMGRQYAQEVERTNRILTSGPAYERLQRAAARIMPLARRDYDVPFTVKLIDSREINAFAVPGGPIYFYKGLVDLTSSEDELASVLGHEATHITRKHTVNQLSYAQAQGLFAGVALGGQSSIVQQLAGLGLALDQLDYSRDDEAEADSKGFQYLVQAGYDPDAMASFFRKMKAQEGRGGGPAFLRSHPLTDSRIRAAEQRAAEYKQGRGGQ